MKSLYTWVRPSRRVPVLQAHEQDLIDRIRDRKITYCGKPKLENIAEAIRLIDRERVPGSFLEAGVALGGSAAAIALLKPKDRALHLYDVFAMIPPPGDQDGPDAHARYSEIKSGNSDGLGGKTYYGYIDGLLDVVKRNLVEFGVDLKAAKVHFHVGLFQDTLHPEGPVAFAHIDADWYDSVMTCLQRIAPCLSPGGIIVFDDYSSYSGCKKAVDQFLADHPNFSILFHRRSLGIRKLR
jgi:predicted O-methyltransferase YrrM